MSRRARRDAQGGPQPDIEVAATTSAIAGLRRRLRRLGLIEDPALRRELRKLEEQLAALFEQAGRVGRHRVPDGKTSGDGEPELKPDPATVHTPAEYITVLWRYRAWSGDPSWRKMATKAKYLVVHSTIYDAMHGQDQPDVVRAIVLGCGGSQDDLDAFTSAWQRIHDAASQDDNSDLLPAPVAALHLAAGTSSR